jgi:hypothetical protein
MRIFRQRAGSFGAQKIRFGIEFQDIQSKLRSLEFGCVLENRGSIIAWNGARPPPQALLHRAAV